MGRLGRVPDGQGFVIDLEVGQDPARLHRCGGYPLGVVFLPDHVIGLGEGRRHVSPLRLQTYRHVGAQLRVDHRALWLNGLVGVHDGREWFVVHRDQLDSLGGDVVVLGYDDGDGLPGVAHFVLGQNGMGRRVHLLNHLLARHGP